MQAHVVAFLSPAFSPRKNRQFVNLDQRVNLLSIIFEVNEKIMSLDW